nr:aflyb hxta hexose transporter [Colletotrichum truncatum]KAF6798659.1 aflyb hxta hexose transporter [Colletotrichum truncatum]
MQKISVEDTVTALSNVSEQRNNCHRSWWKDKGLRELNLRLLAVFISPVMIGYDGALIGGLLTVPQCRHKTGIGITNLGFSPKDTNLTGIMVAGYSIGGAIMFWAVSWAGDIIGRRRVIMLGDIIMIATGKAPSFQAFSGIADCLVIQRLDRHSATKHASTF